MGLDLTAGELDEQVGESEGVEEPSSASQLVRIQCSDHGVPSYPEMFMLGSPVGVGGAADDMSGWPNVMRCECWALLM